MNFQLKQNLPAPKWDDFIKANSLDGGFLQSAGWGDFQADTGRKIWRLAVESDNKIIAAALVIKHQLFAGLSYFYLPRGPVASKSHADETVSAGCDFLLAAIKKIARAEKAIFVRLDPAWPDLNWLRREKFHSVGQVQPKSTLILDLHQSEEELLQQMKSKTRYNIRVAQKHGITANFSQNWQNDFPQFWDLMLKTATRDRIRAHRSDYYLKMLKIPGVKLAFAGSPNLASGRPLVANIMAFWGDWCVYLHGASDYEFRDKMAPYILQWEMIREAKNRGCRFYDFWGADEKKWPGVTRFKIGFSPAAGLTEYAGAYDLVTDQFFYAIYKILKKIKS